MTADGGTAGGGTAGGGEPPCEGVDCSDALAQLHRYLDGELADEHLTTIQAHLVACYPCADRADFEEQLRLVVRTRCRETAPEDLVARVRQRLDGLAADS